MFNIEQITDIGLVRRQNEDSICVEENVLGHKLLIVADGMGGHNAGDVASALCVEIICNEFMQINKQVNYKDFIKHVIVRANQEIYKQSLLDSNLSKMGTTVSLLILDSTRIYTGHVGDSRIYYNTDTKIKQLSKDHTVIQAMKDAGTMSEAEAEVSRYKNMLIQALGTSKKLTIEIKEMTIPNRCCFLLCSDGLTGPVSDDKIHNILLKDIPLPERLEMLVHEANQLDGGDNVSIIVMESEE